MRGPQWRSKEKDTYENKSRDVRNSLLLDGSIRRRTAGLGELQPQPELCWVSHLCVGNRQCKQSPEFDTGASSRPGYRLGSARKGINEGRRRPESRLDCYLQRRPETTDLVSGMGHARMGRRYGKHYT